MADGAISPQTGQESLKDQLNRVLTELKAQREPFVPLWQTIADNFLPFRGRWLNEQPNQKIARNLKIINETPIIALRTFGAGMQAGVTSPARPWWRTETELKELLEAPGVREWLYSTESVMRYVFAKSNFYQSTRPAYSEYGGFGTMAMGVFDDAENGIHCCTYTAGSYYIAFDDKGRPSAFAQEFKWTVRQVVERFVQKPWDKNDPGWKNISPTVRSNWDNNTRGNYVDVVYIVKRNNDQLRGRLDYKGMPFVAMYYEAQRDSGEQMLETKGYREFPIMVTRLAWNEGDSYGIGLAVDCLGSAKALQFHEKKLAIVVDKETDPPLRAPTALRNTRISQLNGDISYVDVPTGQAGIEPISTWKPDRTGTNELIARIEQKINAIMFSDIFAMFVQGEDNPEETATKTAAKEQEKLLMLGPVVESLNHDFLGPLINRVFNICLRQGLFPPPPEALAGQALKVEFIGILSQAQNMIAMQGVTQFTSYVLGVAAQQVAAGQPPTILDKVDFDQAADEVASMSNVVPSIVRTDDMVAQIREARAQQQAQAQQAAQLQQGADTVATGAKAARDISQASADAA